MSEIVRLPPTARLLCDCGGFLTSPFSIAERAPRELVARYRCRSCARVTRVVYEPAKKVANG